MLEVFETMGIPLFLLGCSLVGASVAYQGVSRVTSATVGLVLLASIHAGVS